MRNLVMLRYADLICNSQSLDERVYCVEKVYNFHIGIDLVRRVFNWICVFSPALVQARASLSGYWNPTFDQVEKRAGRLLIIATESAAHLCIQHTIPAKIFKTLVRRISFHKMQNYPILETNIAQGNFNSSSIRHGPSLSMQLI